MKKIIDVNYLREPNNDLHDYLIHHNFVVLTDYAQMEALKGNSLYNLRRSIEIISKYPDQVLFLKETSKIMFDNGKCKGFSRRIIDEKMVEYFPIFCKKIYDENIQQQNTIQSKYFNYKTGQVQKIFEYKKIYSNMIFESIQMHIKELTDIELKEIRSAKPIEEIIIKIMLEKVFMCTALLMKKINSWVNDYSKMRNTLCFRLSLSIFVLIVKWIREGGYLTISEEKKQHDIIDMFYSSYATYFDGVLSFDKKVNEVYRISSNILTIM